MGTGFSVDTPLRVSQYGIDSVISIGDDILIERLRKMYCEKFKLPYRDITEQTEDFRAKRITSYLNLINDLSKMKFEELKNSATGVGNELKEYFNMLPDNSTLKQRFNSKMKKCSDLNEVGNWIKNNLSMGSIDVNIMTKLDKENYFNGKKLPTEYNDAHAALRGYANSSLESSIILSAGINPKLYGYFEQFEDFYPDEDGKLKKKIVLKVSDYRSAFIQGKFLAKKGLWVSEYRVESGLNCGGHAFATDGYLLGPILAKFSDKRKKLAQALFEILVKSLAKKKRLIPKMELPLKITAQGGVGTAMEHYFLLDHYHVDSIGWGTPFLLVPEVTNLDDITRNKLKEAKEDDLYLSDISPLGVSFNNLRDNTKDLEKLSLVENGKPGSPCPKKFLIANTEFTERVICTASHQYQQLKLKEIKKDLDSGAISTDEYHNKHQKVVVKACLCTGLSKPALIVNNLKVKADGKGVSVCPGPDMAYFSKIISLEKMVDHIYGRSNVMDRTDRPNLFVKELDYYIHFLKDEISEKKSSVTDKQKKYLLTFAKNLSEGIDYYERLFNNLNGVFEDTKTSILIAFSGRKKVLDLMELEIKNLPVTKAAI